MENKKLLNKLHRLGYPFLETTGGFDVNETLAEVVKTNNRRYWEGFPILLANGAKEEEFDYRKVEGFLKKKEEKDNLKELFLLSLALYRINKLDFDWPTFYGRSALEPEEKDMVRAFEKNLLKNTEFSVADHHFSSERVKNTFQHYFAVEMEEVKSLSAKREDLSLEFAMSQVFSPKQKNLFLKKLKGEVLTKTEREYFSRTVKKKAMALANSELHHLAQRVFQN